MDIQALQAQRQLTVRQRLRLMVNQYEVHAVGPDGGEGELIAYAQQKRMAFREQVTLYRDDTKTEPVLAFKARQIMDLGATYDVTDAAGQPVGWDAYPYTASSSTLDLGQVSEAEGSVDVVRHVQVAREVQVLQVGTRLEDGPRQPRPAYQVF